LLAHRWGEPFDEVELASVVRSAIADVVRRQAEIGLDVVTDGEYGKHSFNYYSNEGLAGMERGEGVASCPFWRGSPRR